MRKNRKGFWLILTAIISMVVNPLAGVPRTANATRNQPAAQAQRTQPFPSQADLQAVQALLPESPSAAALALVEMIYGPDEAQAQAAVAELLRMSGIPLVSIRGPVIGLPDDLVLYDAATYIELVPELARAVRQGSFYQPDQLAILLAETGLSEEPMPSLALISGLGQWGKDAGAPRESQAASAAVRALSGRRLEVLYPGADQEALKIDPLQTVLILAHATSRARTQPVTASSWFNFQIGVRAAYAQGDPCEELDNLLNPEDETEAFIADQIKGEIIGSWI